MADEAVESGQQVRSGDRFLWLGLPGQYTNDAVIEVVSLTAACAVNARILDPDGSVTLVGIAAADLLAAIGAGWLVREEESHA